MILFVRDLTVIDFSYLHQQRGILGESFIVDVELQGELDDTAMVFDFGKVKKVIKQAIDKLVDHKLAIAADCPRLAQSTEQDMVLVSYQSERGTLQLACPAEAFAFIPGAAINEQSVGSYLEQQIKPLLPANVEKLSLTLRTEAISGFYYQYSHGLKKHDGNCQRIAHGHRSTIQIYADGMLAPRLNKSWCERWQDIYLGTESDLVGAEALQYLTPAPDDLNFRYQAAQGWFELCIPAQHCEVVPCDTTVECLADYIAEQLKQADNSKQYKVVAYEGVGKGAIALR